MMEKTWLTMLILVAACDRNPKAGVEGTGQTGRVVTNIPESAKPLYINDNDKTADPAQMAPNRGPGGTTRDAGVIDASTAGDGGATTDGGSGHDASDAGGSTRP
ncbi:MAG: hypothetical protein H0T42_16590 [Deltaproteobacteria bacterium]|nr:hypothetical protein [Deltaproteobacteria bacterium]